MRGKVQKSSGDVERLGRLSMHGISVEAALRGAMQVPAPNPEPRRKAKKKAARKAARKVAKKRGK